MEIMAKTKYLRTSPRKLRLVAGVIRGLKPSRALVFLDQADKRAAFPLAKTLKSALANAKVKGVVEESLKIKKIEIGGGPIYKRFRAGSRGQAYSLKKRTSHLTVVLEGEK